MFDDNPKCETCRWWKDYRKDDPDEDEPIGECHRFPPVLSNDENSNYCFPDPWFFPNTYFDNFCGEHQPVKAAPLKIAE